MPGGLTNANPIMVLYWMSAAKRTSLLAKGSTILIPTRWNTKGLYKGWRKDIAGKRAFFLVRQAFAGSQHYAATLWSSDVTTTFRALRSQVPQGINACVSGMAYWTSDIGGYFRQDLTRRCPRLVRPSIPRTVYPLVPIWYVLSHHAYSWQRRKSVVLQ